MRDSMWQMKNNYRHMKKVENYGFNMYQDLLYLKAQKPFFTTVSLHAK